MQCSWMVPLGSADATVPGPPRGKAASVGSGQAAGATAVISSKSEAAAPGRRLRPQGTAGTPTCTLDRISYAVGSLVGKNEMQWLEDFKRKLPRVQIVKAVNGYNQTETIEQLLNSQIHFHNLSKDGRKWGKLATWLTKFKLLALQVERRIPFQVNLESDLEVRQPAWDAYMQRLCDRYNRQPDLHSVRCSNWAECFLTSLQGARHMVRTFRERGIYRNDDQQVFDSTYFRTKYVWRYPRNALKAERVEPYVLRRKTNTGDIQATRVLSFAETALLRLVTNPAARSMPLFGNPQYTESGMSPWYSEPMRRRRAKERMSWKQAAARRAARSREGPTKRMNHTY